MAVMYVPPDYRGRYERERHVPYGQWKKDHSSWDKQNKKSHKKWEKEREKEWKESNKGHGKKNGHGDQRGDGGGNHGKHGQ